jgi:drug/metabolite transporter (DMT)-like permease
MGIGISLILGAVGAIIRFALDPSSHVARTFVTWNVVGDILMAAGVLGALASILWMAAATRGGASSTTPREG